MGSLGPEVTAFRASFGAILRLSGFLMFVLLPLVVRHVHRAGWEDWRIVAAGFGSLLLAPILLFVLLGPAVWLFRVRVHELGLRAFDAWGRPREVRWSAITAVQRVDLPGMPYLRVRSSEQGVELFVPLFLARRAAFERAVSDRAGPSNPMTRHFAATGAPSPAPGSRGDRR